MTWGSFVPIDVEFWGLFSETDSLTEENSRKVEDFLGLNEDQGKDFCMKHLLQVGMKQSTIYSIVTSVKDGKSMARKPQKAFVCQKMDRRGTLQLKKTYWK